ncbi:entericidin EcnA/B family protein [Pseudorhodobacter aquimaris]|nr:entericidin EcnA/B family protein [Pseudorhodobacter aquimaris]
MKHMMIQLRPLVLMALLATLAACGTIDGIGRDISGASNRVSDML